MKRLLILAVVTLTACNSDSEGNTTWTVENNGTTTGTNNDSTSSNNTCTGDAPDCSPCSGERLETSVCVDGRWQCPDGLSPGSECPAGSCFGFRSPGEVCDDGFKCRPTPDVLDSCPRDMCFTCDGFDPVLHSSLDCICECGESGVECYTSRNCVVESESSFDGITLRLLGDRCRWDVDDLAEGITIGYELEIDARAADLVIVNTPLNAGNCETDMVAGFLPFWEISNDVDRYCACDVGLCDGNPLPGQTIVPGTYSASFEFFGRNWDGPSDTANPMGPEFSQDFATASVRATATTADGAPIELESTMWINFDPF